MYMKWLIIVSEEQHKARASVKLAKFLEENKTSYLEILTSDIELFSNNPAKLKEINSVTHVVILDESYGQNFNGKLLGFGSQFLFLGLFTGRNLPVYCVNLMHIALTDKLVENFSDIDKLESHIAANFKKIVCADLKRVATKELLDEGIPVTAECFAQFIKKGNLAICQKIRAAGVAVNSRDPLGTPLLNVAVRNDNMEIVKWLLEKGADINAVSEDRGYSAVMDAVWKKNESLVEFLVSNGADLKFISKEGQSILVLAVGIGNLKICKLLAENGADPDTKDSMGMSAYEYAVLFHREEIAKVLKPFHKE